MAPLELEGNTLGEKHRHYNKLLNEALKSNEALKPLDQSTDNDIQNLIKIDVACRTKKVDYILEVLKCEDELYVSKAIKRCTWLITDPQYAHIINPEYLYTDLYSQMTLRAFNKLMLNIRVHLKDEKRVEAFYNYIKERDVKLARKWLQYCSVSFTEREVKNIEEDSKDYFDSHVLQRLFRKSFSVYESYFKKSGYYIYGTKESDSVLKMFPEKVLDFLESCKEPYLTYRFGPKGTKILMKKYPERILNNLDLYGKFLHTATFAYFLKNFKNVEEFLINNVDNANIKWLYANDKIQHFVKQMPKETRFEFVRRVFIDKDDGKEDSLYVKIADRAGEQRNRRGQVTHLFVWYKFAPFEIACNDLDKLIRAEPVPLLRSSMLQVLLSSAGRDINHIRSILQYYHDKHFNEPFVFKIQFVNSFIASVNTHTLDDQTWNLLCKLFHSLEVFIESNNNVQSCIKAIIVRNAIRNEAIPDIIEKKFVFDTLIAQKNKLKNQEEKEAVFKYLNDFIKTKSESLNLCFEPDFEEAVTLCKYLLQLLKDWGKELHDHPNALARVKELIVFKNKNQWGRDLGALYNMKKSWRKEMFQESIAIMQNEAVCMNALRHDPGLLFRYKDHLLAMSSNDTVTLRNLLRKMRIYWPLTLAEDWKAVYLNLLSQPNGQKAGIGGLCALLPQEQTYNLLKQHAPSDTKINWTEADHLELNLCKLVAKNIHKARPLPPIEGILLYAKGDYLQFAVPSINAVLSQLSPNKSRTLIPVLLNAPLSLKKFGIRSAIRKLSSEELTPMITEIWNSTRNNSIRTVIFTHTLQLLCKGKNTSHIKDTWNLMSLFIDKLTPNDSPIIFKSLGEFYRVPTSVQPIFFMKSFAFISSLPAKCNCKRIFESMQYSALDYVEFFDDEFVIKVLLNNFENIFSKKRDTYDKKECFIPAYILSSKDEDTQVRRYEKTLDILLEQYLPQWETNKTSKDWLESLLGRLESDMETYTFEKKMQIPSKVFQMILLKLENGLSYQKNYVFLTMWKLATAFVKILKDKKGVLDDFKRKSNNTMDVEEKNKMFDTVHETIAPLFASVCVQYLKEDIIRFGRSIHLLMADAFKKLFHTYIPGTMYASRTILYLKPLLECGNETELYLMVCDVLHKEIQSSCDFQQKENKMCKEIYELVMPHCSDEIKMHFYDAFKETALPDIE